MPPNTVQIQIIPETDTLHLFRDETTMMNETYDFRGHIRLIPIIYKKGKKKRHASARPISVHQIHLRLQGYVQTMLTSDFSDSDKGADQRWCKDTTTLPLLDRILYSARGYANVTECVLDQQLTLTPGIISLNRVTDIAFDFVIENTQRLPPSVTSPRHLICYYVSATIHQQEDNACMYIFPRSTSSLPILSPSTSSSLSSSSASEDQHQRKKRRFILKPRPIFKSLINKLSPSPSSSATLSSSSSFSSFNNSNAPISVRLPITVQCHHLGSMYAFTHQPRIRYCGARTQSLRYQIHLAKNFLLQPMGQPTDISFYCSFLPLSSSIKIQRLVCYLVQYETYPIRSGQIHSIEPLPENQLETKARKIGFKELLIEEGDNLERLPLSVTLNNPQLVPPVNTVSLQVTHKLRLAVYFQGKEKKMTLSFPITLCTIPPTTPTAPPTQFSMTSLPSALLTRMYNSNNFIMDTATDESQQNSNDMDNSESTIGCKLPTYLDVMSEGPPPSPFLEDQILSS